MNFLIQNINYYDFEKLKNAALQRPNIENLDALAAWYDAFGAQFWNGEEWKIDDTRSLRPVYDDEIIISYQII